MTSTRFPSSPDEPSARRALAAGLAAFVCVGGAAALVAFGCREALAAYFSGTGALGLVAAAALAALVAGFAVERHCRLQAVLKRQEAEACEVRAELVRSNRALVALGAVNHELIHATDRDVFLAGVCRVLVEQAGYDLVWVGMAEQGATSRVRVAAKAGEDAQWLDSLEIRYDDGVRGHGPAGTAIREGRIVSMPRFAQDASTPNGPTGRRRWTGFRRASPFPCASANAWSGRLASTAARSGSSARKRSRF